jgi:hypothetical protein
MYDHVEELQRVNNMDQHQILLKVRNLKYMPFMTKEQFNELRQAISDRLQTHGYELTSACCGRFSATKLNKE